MAAAKSKKNNITTAQNTVPKMPQNTQSLPSWLPIVGVLVLIFLAFIPALDNEFVNWDDDLNILKNDNIKAFTAENIAKIFSSNIMGGYNPLSIFTFAVEYALVGEENLAASTHFVNIALHLVTAFFVYQLARQMGLNIWIAAALTLLFGIHPMRVESVAWATERKDVLFASFYFAALVQWAKYCKSNDYTFKNKYYWLTFLLFIGSLFSKVQSVSLPLSMLCLDYFFNRKIAWRLIFEKTFFWLAALALGVFTVILLKEAKTIDESVTTFSFAERLLIGAYSFVVYSLKWVFPYEMLPLYPYPTALDATFWAAPLVFFAACGAVFWAWKKELRWLVFGAAFFFVNFIFVSQIVGAGQGFLADRFTYVAYFGFWAMLFGHFSEKKWANWATFAFGGYALFCFFSTYTQNDVWQNSDTLWSHELKYRKNVSTAYQNRALYFRDKKNFTKALADLNESVRIKAVPQSLNSRGKTYFDMGKAQLALNDYNAALSTPPSVSAIDEATKAEILANRGAALGAVGKLDSAFADLNLALQLDKKQLNALKNRSLAYQMKGDFAAAVADDTYYLSLKKDDAEIWFERGALLRQLGKCNEAMPDFEKAIKLDNKNGRIYLERAYCYKTLGNEAAAKADAQAAKMRGIDIGNDF